MSLSPRCYALSQITSLVASISRKNFKTNQAEIEKLIELYGPDADKHLFRCLVSSVDFTTDGRNLGKDGQQLQLLIQEANALITKPNFVSILCYAFEKQENVRPTQQLFSQLVKVLKLTKVQEVVFALGLKKSSDSDLQNYASQHLKIALPELVRSYSDFSSGLEGGLAEVAIEVLHLLLSHLLESPQDEVGVNKEAIETFVRTMRQDFPRERVPVVLAPLLYREQQDITEDRLVPVSVALPSSVSSINLADVIKEVGYMATASKQDMLEILKDYGKTQINTKQVARVLGMMASTLTNLPESVPFMGGMSSDPAHFAGKSPSTWDIRVFVQSLQSILPNLNWREVILYLDYPEFHLSSPEGLNLIVSTFKLATRDTFPLECFYLSWRNTRGHLSLLKQAIIGCPEFSVAQYPMVIMQLNDEHKYNLSSEDAKTWRSLSLIESLLQLSEQGHYEEVMNVLHTPMSKCPEILFLGVIKAKVSGGQHEPYQWCMVQQDVINQVLPVFIANHPTYSPVLYDAWHSSTSSPQIQIMMVQSLSHWCYQADPPDSARIARVLEVAKDLKVIMSMVNTDQFPFVIELAAFAAKRDFLNLDKWITDKMKAYQEVFVAECVQLLLSRVPKPLSQQGSERMGLTHDIVTSILASLQPCIGTLKPDLAEKLRGLIATHGPLPPKPRANSGTLGLQTPTLDMNSGGLPGLPFFGPTAATPMSPKTSTYGAASYPPQQAQQQPPMQQGFPMDFGGGMAGFGGGGQAKHPHQAAAAVQLQQQQQQLQQQQQQLGQAAKPLGDPIILGPEQTFSKDVDDKANAYFQAIYNRGMNVDRLLELLKQFKDSLNKKERDLFVCMLRNMFEEYKFFPQFPEKELQITGQLFGGIIEHGLVTYMSLSLALRYVLDSLKKVPGTKMYLFGVAALDKFKTRLHEFPQYCASIATIPHFQSFPNYLKQYVQFGQQSIEPPPAAIQPAAPVAAPTPVTPVTPVNPFAMQHANDPGTPLSIPGMLPPINTNRMPPTGLGGTGSSPLGSPVTTPSGQLSPSLAGVGSPLGSGGPVKSSAGSPLGAQKRDQTPSINTTNIDTLLVAADQQQAPPPPEELQDRIHFLFNNLSASNLTEKTEELKSLIGDDHIDWVAQYLVMKRASIEPNFHNLYINFMDTLGSTPLRKTVLRETYRNIKVILRADKTTNNFSDRAILKNLGHWLGMQTLAKNKPILQNDLAVKDLVREAHYKGEKELLYVVPFVAKVLESCAESRIFKPPNPWTMAIMSVLSELHSAPDLKLNLRFEVEVLCKHLNMEIADIPPGNLLKDTEGAKNFNQLSPPNDQASPDEGGVVGGPPGGPLGASGPGAQPVPPQPLFHPDDINVQSLAGLTPHLQINPQIALLQQYPQLKQYIRPAVEKAVQDLLVPVAERSIKIALTTTEHIIRKDFALDPDIHRMHLAAHHMVRHLTAGMALITCREPLLLSISTNLKAAFTNTLRAQAEELKPLIEQAAHQISAENTELACAFIQKTSMEKATPEMDKRLAEEFELRKQARAEGRRYCNTGALTYQAERMPEQIRLNVGGPSLQQAAVYEEFSRCLPGFLPISAAKQDGMYAGKTEFVPNEEFLQILLKCIQEISQHLRVALAPPNNPHILMMRALLEMTMQLRISQSHQNVIALLQKALEGLLEGMNPPPSDPDLFVSFRDCHLLILKMVQGHSGLGPETAMYHVTRILLSAREDIKYSPRAIILLIGMQIVDMKLLDEHLAKAIENGRNLVALSCSIKLVNAIVSAEKRETPITDKDLLKAKETLYRLAANVKLLPDSSAQLLEPFRINHDIQLMSSGGGGIIVGPGGSGFGGAGLETAFGGGGSMPHQGVTAATGHTSELEDPPGLYEKVEYLLSEWVRHFHQPGLLREGDKIYAAYVARLQQQGILKSDDLITRFFRISTEMCVDLCYRTINDPSINAAMARAKSYHTMDAFVKLVVVLVRYSGDTSNVVTKINLLNKVLVTVATVLHHDHESRHTEFHQLAYHRFFIMLLNDLCTPDPVFDTINFPVLHAFCQVYHIIRPSRAPGFAYSWLELISHRVFIAKLLLQTPQQKGWPLFHQLLIDLFKFLAPFLRNAELTKPTQLLYKGTLRVLLVLLHDFPEFLCDYHFSFCDVIPPNCIQMRNLILSAFPRNMRLPDPFTPNLKVEMLPDIAHAPRILPNFTQHIPAAFKKDLDNYIRTRAPVTFLQELRGHLTVSSDPGNQYSVSLMNSLVLYVGTQAISFIHNKGNTPSTSTIAHTAHMDIFQHLVVDLDTEGRYLFLNAIANQLRYPNSHTHYFSCALLSLFAETNAEAIQEQITRVLLERLIVNRPHPWGLLITFIELIKNPTYNFWKHEFVHCAPEIEKLFGSVAKSCMQKQPQSGAQREEGAPHEMT